MTIDFTPTWQQDLMFKTFGDENALEILFGGAAGGGKSYGLWSLAILKALEFPGIRVGIARQTLTQIKGNTISTFYEVMNHWNLDERYYNYNQIKGEITFPNGSMLKFFELRYLPSDPNYDRFGGALLTFGIIEEAAGCDAKGKEVFSSRLGRWMNDTYDIPPHLYMSTNPGVNFVYSDFYIPDQKGELADHRRYIPAKLTDNTYRGKAYETALRKRLNEETANRLLRGEWNFDGDNTRLTTYQNVVDVYNIPKGYKTSGGTKYLTADIAFTGDRCIMLLWDDLTVTKVMHYEGKEPEVELARLATLHNVPQENIAYDADGVGKYLKGKFPRAIDIINNSVPLLKENYYNLKSQLYFKLADVINEGLLKVKDDTLQDNAIQELYEIRSVPLESTDGKLKLISKKDVKKVIGRSPDISDAIAFRMYWLIKRKIMKPF